MAKFKFIEWLADWIENQTEFAFEWDSGNISKNLDKHGVTCEEAESVFWQTEAIRVLGEQVSPKTSEPRFGLFGIAITGRSVFVCFTLRGSGIRVISVRELNKKEIAIYEILREE